MSVSKIEIKVGIVEFSGEGDPKWLSQQLDKILDRIPEFRKMELEVPPIINEDKEVKDSISDRKTQISGKPGNLASYLKSQNATNNQTKKFLATAVFLQGNGKNRLMTSEVSTALKKAKQPKLTNPSQMLINNIKKGFCEKDGKQFFVTKLGEGQMK